MKAVLTEIDGIGFSTNQVLLRKFKSVKNIQLASIVELQGVIGKAKAKIVYDYFHKS
jgi:excinuclease ABC subunit C